jgi:creatinine amidohydrolase
MNLADLRWPDVQALDKNTPVVVPIAALEQHGHHLPLFTDSMLLGEIVRWAAVRMESRVLFAPLMWLGNSDHHLDFPGTLSGPPRAYLDLLCGLMDNVLHHGFKRVVLLNGHGGNDVPARQAIFEVRQRNRRRNDLLLLAATYWNLGGRPYEMEPGIFQRQMGHACEWETSMMLRIAPQLVGEFSRLEPVEPGGVFEPASRGWVTQDRSTPGHIGHPHLASAAKGEVLLRVFSDDVTSILQRVVDWDGKPWA